MNSRRPYTLFRCTKTMSLYKEACAAGYNVWIPTLTAYHKDHRTKELVKSTVAAIPGYLFALHSEWQHLLKWCEHHPRFQLGICTVLSKPVRVSASDLDSVRQACELLNKKKVPVALTYAIGDRVEVTVGPLVGSIGQIESLRKSSARILFGTKYVGIPLAFVRKL